MPDETQQEEQQGQQEQTGQREILHYEARWDTQQTVPVNQTTDDEEVTDG